MQRIINHYILPILIGLIIGLCYLAWPTLSQKFTTDTAPRIHNELPHHSAEADHQSPQPNQAHYFHGKPSQSLAPVSYATAVDAASPAVVNLYASKSVVANTHPLLSDPKFQQFLGRFNLPKQKQQMKNSLGSGVFIGDEGYVLTNRHVIQGAEQISVALSDGRKALARIVGTDPATDLAVLAVDIKNPPHIPLPQRDYHLRVGDIVMAIGNPFGFNQSVSLGIISALGRSNLGITTYENFIQIDAAINPGNSGGALINAYGELIGINTAVFNKGGEAQGIGFAIPVEVALLVMSDLVKYGKVNRGWLGVETIDLTPALAARFDIPYHPGILITKLIKNGPAHLSGMLPGDIITHINQAEIASFRSASRQVAMIRPNDHVEMNLIRVNSPLKATLVAAEHPDLR